MYNKIVEKYWKNDKYYDRIFFAQILIILYLLLWLQEGIMTMIRTTQLNDKDDDGNYKHNKVIQSLAGNKYIFERKDDVWIQKKKATEKDEEKIPVVMDD